MNRLTRILLSCCLGLAIRVGAADDPAREEAIGILSDIAATCQTRGIEACRPNLRGLEPLFAYLHAFPEMQETEKQFVAFVRKRYSMPDFTMDKMAAHLNVDLNVSVDAHMFDGKVTNVTRVPGGYDVQMPDGLVRLRRESQVWIASMPEGMEAKLELPRRYAAAASLKRSIMTYRMLEAELLDYDLDAFATRFVSDLGPLTVATLRRQDLVAQMPDWQQRLQDVIGFYSRFKNVDDMRTDILANRGSTEN